MLYENSAESHRLLIQEGGLTVFRDPRKYLKSPEIKLQVDYSKDLLV